ncbi:MAG: hypothetical protein WCT02_03935 [Candidatus Paceibacterota bacterium]
MTQTSQLTLTIETLKREIQKETADLRDAENQYTATTTKKTELENQIKEKEISIKQKEIEIQQLKTEVQKARTETVRLERDADKLKKDVERMKHDQADKSAELTKIQNAFNAAVEESSKKPTDRVRTVGF